jgi:hypothetical protein
MNRDFPLNCRGEYSPVNQLYNVFVGKLESFSYIPRMPFISFFRSWKLVRRRGFVNAAT